MKRRALAILAAAIAAAWPAAQARAQGQPTPLFAEEAPIRIAITGPIMAVANGDRRPRPATLTLQAPASETLPITIAPRGITRLRRDVCQFAPFRVDLTTAPPPTSLFHQQRRLKLVTHCQGSAGFQKHVLLEYAAYRLFNVLTPQSYRVRLADIEYRDPEGRPLVRRMGFFIEDIGHVAARTGASVPAVDARVPRRAILPRAGARFSLFQYLIGNLDWGMTAGPAGEPCCHNGRLIAAPGSEGAFTPVPYDFDHAGLVDAPYATPPEIVPIRSVRSRYYRGYCAHNGEVPAAVAEILSRRSELLAALAAVPGLDERARGRASAYLQEGLAEIGNPLLLQAKVLRTCLP
jgi:hypothetical protein